MGTLDGFGGAHPVFWPVPALRSRALKRATLNTAPLGLVVRFEHPADNRYFLPLAGADERWVRRVESVEQLTSDSLIDADKELVKQPITEFLESTVGYRNPVIWGIVYSIGK